VPPFPQVSEVFVGLRDQWEQQYSESTGLPPTYAPDERFPDAQRFEGGQGLAAALERNRGRGAFLYQASYAAVAPPLMCVSHCCRLLSSTCRC